MSPAIATAQDIVCVAEKMLNIGTYYYVILLWDVFFSRTKIKKNLHFSNIFS